MIVMGYASRSHHESFQVSILGCCNDSFIVLLKMKSHQLHQQYIVTLIIAYKEHVTCEVYSPTGRKCGHGKLRRILPIPTIDSYCHFFYLIIPHLCLVSSLEQSSHCTHLLMFRPNNRLQLFKSDTSRCSPLSAYQRQP